MKAPKDKGIAASSKAMYNMQQCGEKLGSYSYLKYRKCSYASRTAYGKPEYLSSTSS
jgi:hypothetical protein